jgi:hypothetical protein
MSGASPANDDNGDGQADSEAVRVCRHQRASCRRKNRADTVHMTACCALAPARPARFPAAWAWPLERV